MSLSDVILWQRIKAPRGTGRFFYLPKERRRIAIDKREEARRLYEDEGLALCEIANTLGLNYGSLRAWKSRHKWKSPDRNTGMRSATGRTATGAAAKRQKERTRQRMAEVIEAAPLKELEKNFCVAYVSCWNASQAARTAGYKGTPRYINTLAYTLMHREDIKAYIRQLKAIKRGAILANGDDLLDLAQRIVFADITQYAAFDGDEVALRPSSEVDGQLVKKVSCGKGGPSVELKDAKPYLDLLLRMVGLDKTEADMQEQAARIEALKAKAQLSAAETAAVAGATQISDTIWRELMNPAYAEFLTDERPLQIFYGGSSSGKSFGILGQRTVRDIMTGKRNYLIVRKTGRTIRNSSFNEVKKCIERMGLSSEFGINRTDMVITHTATGCQVIFGGLDDVEKVKSITPSSGVLTDIIMEEATECDYNDYKGLLKRLRGGDERTIKRVVLLFNPVLQDSWIYEQFFAGKWDEAKDYYGDDKMLIRKTTYKDNRWLTEDDRRKLEDETDRYYYDVYTLGNWGVLGNLIFTNWEAKDLSELKQTWAKHHNGLDFGFFPDPAAFVRVGLNRAKREVYIFAETGGQGYTNDQLAKELRPLIGQEVVTCDSSEPKSIQELCNFGLCAVPARKGPGSVEFGIKWLQKQRIYVDVSCVQTISELRKYKYMEDRNGNVLPKPVDRDNHFIDALRYALEAEMVETVVR